MFGVRSSAGPCNLAVDSMVGRSLVSHERTNACTTCSLVVTDLYPKASRMRAVRWRTVGCCVVVAAAMTGCATARASHPVPFTRMPARPLSFGEYRVQGGGKVCRTRIPGAEYHRASRHSRSAVPVVSTTVSGATAFWLPGAQGTPCRSVRTAIPRPAAHEIAMLVNRARAFFAGSVSCGFDDGTEVWLYLHPRHTQRVQKLVLTPTGCLTVNADDLWPRFLPEAVMRTLAPYAPPGWANYLHHGV